MTGEASGTERGGPTAGLLGFARRRPAVVLLAALVATSIFFLVFPGLDLAVSRRFYDGDRFGLAADPTLRFVRDLGRYAAVALIVAAGLGLLVPLLRGWRRFGLAPHQSLYVLAVFALGPGLIVNGVFKEFFGRARPREVLEFGGGAAFSKVWVVSESCVGNCSFVSGEAASAAALLALVFAVPRSDRLVVGLGLTAVAAVFSVNRIAFGGHFLSDVLIAWMLVLLVEILLRPVFLGGRGQAIDASVLRAAGTISPWRRRLDAGLVRRLRRAVGRPAAGPVEDRHRRETGAG